MAVIAEAVVLKVLASASQEKCERQRPEVPTPKEQQKTLSG
jgi:hypothetical protein